MAKHRPGIPPKNQHTIRYYGRYSNKCRGMWEGIVDIPPPPEPPYDIETMEPIRVPALFRWAQEEDPKTLDASHLPWQAPELPLEDERILVLDGDPAPPDEFPGSAAARKPGPRKENPSNKGNRMEVSLNRPDWELDRSVGLVHGPQCCLS